MNKVATYLRGHLSGEVRIRTSVLEQMADDGGILNIKPEMVISPRSTNDIRKVARFSWQLAEKGHAMPVTARGAGYDPTGGSISKGIIVSMREHMSRIFEFDSKQHLVRLQPGVTVEGVQQALALYGQHIPSLVGSRDGGTVGGAIGVGVVGPMAGKYGTIAKSLEQLEVVLANGDVLQTGRINKRELGKRKGEQGFVGDIYRGIDRIIEENADLLDNLRSDDATGYNTIADVKQKDGSFDLTPLFIGSQGTLGIISEMIMRTEFKGNYLAVGAFVYEKTDEARDAFDELCRMNPAFIDYFDGKLFDTAAVAGKTYEFYAKASESFTPGAVIIMGFDDISDRARAKHLKKLQKVAERTGTYLATADHDEAEELMTAMHVAHYTIAPDKNDDASPDLFSGFQVPGDRFEKFYEDLQELASSLKVELPLAGHVYTGVYSVYPTFDFKKVSDKQKVLKLLDELSKLIIKHGGAVISEGGEGRLKAKFVYPHIDEKLVKMYEDVKNVCDPRGVFNKGVKEQADMHTLVGMMRSGNSIGR